MQQTPPVEAEIPPEFILACDTGIFLPVAAANMSGTHLCVKSIYFEQGYAPGGNRQQAANKPCRSAVNPLGPNHLSLYLRITSPEALREALDSRGTTYVGSMRTASPGVSPLTKNPTLLTGNRAMPTKYRTDHVGKPGCSIDRQTFMAAAAVPHRRSDGRKFVVTVDSTTRLVHARTTGIYTHVRRSSSGAMTPCSKGLPGCHSRLAEYPWALLPLYTKHAAGDALPETASQKLKQVAALMADPPAMERAATANSPGFFNARPLPSEWWSPTPAFHHTSFSDHIRAVARTVLAIDWRLQCSADPLLCPDSPPPACPLPTLPSEIWAEILRWLHRGDFVARRKSTRTAITLWVPPGENPRTAARNPPLL